MKLKTFWRGHWIVLILYSLLTLLLTWPLISHITTHVPGVPQWAFDESTFLWNIWHFKHALVDNLRTPLHSELIWYPLGIDLIVYTYNAIHALVAFPLAVVINLPFASNFSLLLSTVLSGYGTYLLVRYLLNYELRIANCDASPHSTFRIPPSAFVAGLLYAFASNRAIYAMLGHYNIMATQWIPFYALMLLRTLDGSLASNKRRKAALLAGIFFAFTGLAEMGNALMLGIFTAIVLVIWLIRRLEIGDWRLDKLLNLQSPISNLLIIALVAFLLWSPLLVPVLRQLLSENFVIKGWGETIPLSADLLGWFTPTILHPFFGGDLVTELNRVKLRAIDPNGVGFRDLNTVFLGWVTLAIAIVGAIAQRRKVAIWLWTTFIFGILSLGPFLQINGQYRFNFDGEEATFPLPFLLLHYLPIISANRAPNRNSVLLMLGLAVLVGYGVFWVVGRLGKGEREKGGKGEQATFSLSPLQTGIYIFLALCILFEHLALPAPLSDARIPVLYTTIAADPRPVSVLQLPLGWRNSFEVFGPEATLLQYYQSAHGKPIIGGNISRAPDFKLDYFRRLPFFQALTDIEFGRAVTPQLLNAARTQAPQLAQLYNLGYVILYPPIPDRQPYADHWQPAWDFVKQTLPLEAQPFWAEDGIEAYRVILPPTSDHFRIDLGATGTFLYRGEGWDSVESDTIYDINAIWATATNSRLFVPLQHVDVAAHYSIAMHLHPFAFASAQTQMATLWVNAQPFAPQSLSAGWQTITWDVPGNALINGLNRLQIDWGHTAIPRQVLGGNRLIGSTGIELPIDVEVNAFADGAFIALFADDGTQIDGSAGRDGVNVTVLDPQSGEIVVKRGFDTSANQFESTKLADFIAAIEPGMPVIVASKGNASAFLNQAAVDGLLALGADLSLERVQGQYFAIIGEKGAQPASARTEIGADGAYLTLSRNRDQRTLAAAVDWVEVKSEE